MELHVENELRLSDIICTIPTFGKFKRTYASNKILDSKMAKANKEIAVN